MVTVVSLLLLLCLYFELPSIDLPLRCVCFLFPPPFPAVCVCLCVCFHFVSHRPESLVSPSAHPGGARAPPGGQNRGRPAGPGAAQTLGEHRWWSASQRVERPLAVSCPPGDVGGRGSSSSSRCESDGKTRAEGKCELPARTAVATTHFFIKNTRTWFPLSAENILNQSNPGIVLFILF